MLAVLCLPTSFIEDVGGGGDEGEGEGMDVDMNVGEFADMREDMRSHSVVRGISRRSLMQSMYKNNVSRKSRMVNSSHGRKHPLHLRHISLTTHRDKSLGHLEHMQAAIHASCGEPRRALRAMLGKCAAAFPGDAIESASLGCGCTKHGTVHTLTQIVHIDMTARIDLRKNSWMLRMPANIHYIVLLLVEASERSHSGPRGRVRGGGAESKWICALTGGDPRIRMWIIVHGRG